MAVPPPAPRPAPRRFLIVGGAGFVGSHLVAALLARGDACVVLDNLRTGHRAAVLPGARLVEADLADGAAIEAVLADGSWDGVFHFAALSLVGESMAEPMRYIGENLGHGVRLIEACIRHGVRRFVLSSTAALFGTPDRLPIDETTRIDPGSPYGESKWMLERALLWAGRVHGLRSACLRYFNAAGADPEGRLGEDHRPETHLIPLVIDAALGRRPSIQVFGTDYDTPDGTCIRDYVHVSDLAEAHLLAFERLEQGSITYNLGSARGHSVREVIRAVQRVSGRAVPVVEAPRRAGDPAVLVASSARMHQETGWQPRFLELDEVVRTAFAWRVAHPDGYGAQTSQRGTVR
ncbi:MAG: UDP-glucose 4-epimerase GalE [Rhodospirillales bacterium]|nr:UDP-glucose 4-epimerase GalE [Rhodospirillales bacterium]